MARFPDLSRYRLAGAGLIVVVLLSGTALGFPPGSPSNLISPPSLSHQVFQYVNWKYVDPSRSEPAKLLAGAFRHLENSYPEVLLDWDRDGRKVFVRVDEERRSIAVPEKLGFNESAGLIEEVLAFVSPRLNDDIDEELLRYMTLNGALGELDPHSNVFSMKHYKDFKVRTSGSFGGIGFTFGIHDGDLTIISPIPDTPADRAGLMSGDRILLIDSEPTTNMGTDAAVSRMRGEPGTKVTLTIAREGWSEPRDFPITREIIHIVSVDKNVLSGDGETPVLYVSIKNFQEDTSSELRKAIEESDSDEIAGVIVDLRNNPGGLLQQAIEISDGFLDEGVIVSTRSRNQKKTERAAASDDKLFTRKPLVILLNRGSASASEIVAAALQDSRALVIGRTSFGKGSVQQAYPLMDGGGLLLTVSQYLTPGDISIQSIGIQPDIVVNPVEVAEGKLRLGPPPLHAGEAALENAFNEWGNAKREPEARIEYLRPPEPEEREDFRIRSSKEKVTELTKEFEVRLSRKIIGAVEKSIPLADRSALLPAARKVVAELDDSEKSFISEAMDDVGVDWEPSSGEGGTPDLAVIFPDEFSLKAGDDASLTIKVKNTGETAAFQVWGDTDSENALLKNIDFAFGRIEPGEERSWTAQLKVPKAVESRWDKVEFNIKTPGLDEGGTFTSGVLTVASPLPEFAYTYSLDDENSEDPSRSGNGLLEKGERARLLLKVRNTGEVESSSVEVNLSGGEAQSLYLDEVRQRIDGIPPGESREVPLSFRILEAKEDGEVEIRISLSDRDHGVFFSDSLDFPIDRPYPRIQARIPPKFTVKKSPPSKTESEKVSLVLEVSDDEEVKEVYTYRGDKKVHYSSNPAGGPNLPVEVTVPLDTGMNRIVVVARDQKNITSQKVFNVHRFNVGETYSEVVPAK